MKKQSLTFEMKLGAGFLATILAAIAICTIALYGLNESIKISRSVISDYAQDLILAGRLRTQAEASVATSRGFLITGNKVYLEKMEATQRNFLKDLEVLQNNNKTTPHDQLLLDVKIAYQTYQKTLGNLIKKRVDGTSLRDLINIFENQLQPDRDNLEKSVNDYIAYTKSRLENERRAFIDSNKSIFHLIIAVSAIALVLAIAMALVITKTLSRLYNEVKNAAKMREEIVEMVSHDLRNPIAAVSLSTQLLLKLADSKNTISSDELRTRIENIKRATSRVNGLVDSLLDLTRIKTGTLSIEKSNVYPKDILSDTFELFDNIAKEKDILLEVQQDQIPFIQCDFERIVQVFSNLIGNALKFSVANQKIIFGARAQNDSVVFFVTDQGPGISKEEQDQVFERYWQTGHNKKAGAGLGLAICKGIVTAHGGKIWLESINGSGTTFYFSIPVKS